MASVYLQMHVSGCILFTEWNCRFLCAPNESVNTMVDFGLATEVIRGHNDQPGDLCSLSRHVFDICGFLTECLSDWNEQMSEKRREFPSINYFSTKQLVVLQKELAHLINNNELSTTRPFPLLHPILNNCTIEKLQKAIDRAEADLREIKQHQISGQITEGYSDDHTNEDELIDNLTISGITHNIALKALKKFGSDGETSIGK